MREVIKIESVKKGRRGRIKKASKSDLKGYFIVAIQSNIEVLINKLI